MLEHSNDLIDCGEVGRRGINGVLTDIDKMYKYIYMKHSQLLSLYLHINMYSQFQHPTSQIVSTSTAIVHV